MSNGLYKATIHIRCLGQEIVNTLWYRSVLEGTVAGDLLIDAARGLGTSIITHIWNSAYKPLMPSFSYLDRVTIMGYNDQYELLYNNTISVSPANSIAAGTGSSEQVYLPIANVVNLSFSLANRFISLPWFRPPKKGLVAVSMVREDHVGNDGTLNDAGSAAYQPLAEALVARLPWDIAEVDIPILNWVVGLGIPFAFVPMRAKTWQWDLPQILGGITYSKHIETTDIEICNIRKQLGYRRSRKVED